MSENGSQFLRHLARRNGDDPNARMTAAIERATGTSAARLPAEDQPDPAFVAAHESCDTNGLDPASIVTHLTDHERQVVLASVGDAGQPVVSGDPLYAAAATVRQDQRAADEGWPELSYMLRTNVRQSTRFGFDAVHSKGLVTEQRHRRSVACSPAATTRADRTQLDNATVVPDPWATNPGGHLPRAFRPAARAASIRRDPCEP